MLSNVLLTLAPFSKPICKPTIIYALSDMNCHSHESVHEPFLLCSGVSRDRLQVVGSALLGQMPSASPNALRKGKHCTHTTHTSQSHATACRKYENSLTGPTTSSCTLAKKHDQGCYVQRARSYRWVSASIEAHIGLSKNDGHSGNTLPSIKWMHGTTAPCSSLWLEPQEV